MNRRMYIAALLPWVFAGLAAASQTPAPMPPQPAAEDITTQANGPALKQNPLEALRNFEPAADEAYRLGKGDEITVNIAGRPDLDAKLVVGPDGCVTLPLAGDVKLDGMTRPEAGKAIEAALAQ